MEEHDTSLGYDPDVEVGDVGVSRKPSAKFVEPHALLQAHSLSRNALSSKLGYDC